MNYDEKNEYYEFIKGGHIFFYEAQKLEEQNRLVLAKSKYTSALNLYEMAEIYAKNLSDIKRYISASNLKDTCEEKIASINNALCNQK